MSKPDRFDAIFKWTLGLIFGLFVVVGIYRLYGHWLGDDQKDTVQLAAKADLQLVAQAEKAFHAVHGFYTTDIVSLNLAPKYVFYKVGFIQASSAEQKPQGLAEYDPTHMTLDALKTARPDVKLEYADRTKLDQIDFQQLASYCADCTATAEGYKVMAVANLDDDADLDIWTLDQNGALVHVVDDLKELAP